MSHDNWITIGVTIIGLAIQGCAVFMLISRKLTQVCEAVKHLRERCKERAIDHKHHFDGLEDHGLRLENHEVRLVQLEKQPS